MHPRPVNPAATSEGNLALAPTTAAYALLPMPPGQPPTAGRPMVSGLPS